jgi:hypothetical protein
VVYTSYPQTFRMGLRADHDLEQAQFKLGQQLERNGVAA